MIEIISEIMKAGPTLGPLAIALMVFVLSLYYRIQKRITLTHMVLVDEDLVSLETLAKYKLLEVGFW